MIGVISTFSTFISNVPLILTSDIIFLPFILSLNSSLIFLLKSPRSLFMKTHTCRHKIFYKFEKTNALCVCVYLN